MSVRTSLTRRRRRYGAVVAATSVTLLLGACGGGGSAGSDGELSIATGGTGGVYYPLGGGIATVIRKNVEGQDASVQETNASVDNMLLVQAGDADLALAVGDVVANAVDGEGDFDNKLDVCSMGSMYNNYMQPVTTKGSGVGSVEDMKNKTISVGAPGSATEVLAERVLEVGGVDPEKDIKRRQLGAAETVDALKDGTIDAGFWSGGLPTGALVELASTGDMALVPIGEYAKQLSSEYGDYYVEDSVPAGTYEGQKKAVPVIASPNILVASNEMDSKLQENLTGAIFDHKKQLIKVHPAAKELDAKTAGDVPFIDTCKGSQAYFDKAGS